MINNFYKNFKVRDYMNEEQNSNALNKKLIDCSLGTNPFLEKKDLKKYIVRYATEINKYPTLQYELLKEELLVFWKNYLLANINKKNIAFGSGTMGILRNICEILIQENTKVLGIAPQFPRFISEIELKKGIYEYYTLKKENNFRFNCKEFIKKMDYTYQVISIENPNNPTGQIIDIKFIEDIVKKAKQLNSYVIIDEAYGDYMPPENSAITLVEKYNNIMVLKSASKFYGLPNHRIGYMFASEEIIKIYNEIALPFPFSDLSASIFTQILKEANKFEYTRIKTKKIKEKLCSELNPMNYLYTDKETPIFTIKSTKYKNLAKKLLEEGIIAEDCGIFINLDSSYARIRINKDYEKIIKILLSVLK